MISDHHTRLEAGIKRRKNSQFLRKSERACRIRVDMTLHGSEKSAHDQCSTVPSPVATYGFWTQKMGADEWLDSLSRYYRSNFRSPSLPEF